MQQGSDTEAAEPLIGRGHAAGDLLEAWNWTIIEHGRGRFVVDAHVPEHLKNPAGQLFGGFTPTYVDLVSIYALRAADDEEIDPTTPQGWVTTVNMRCDYFEPIMGPTVRIEAEVVNRRGRNALVAASFFQGVTMAAHAITTLRVLDA